MTNNIPEMLQRAWPTQQLDEYDEADVERRGQRLRHRRTTTTTLLTGVVVLTVLVSVSMVFAGVLRGSEERQATSQPTESTQATPSPREHQQLFVPATRQEGERRVMPVTFPDGTTAEVVYPSELQLAELGVRPGGGFGTLEGDEFDGCCARDFLFEYGDTGQSLLASARTIKEFPRPDGPPVRLVSPADEALPDYLVFEIGEWRLGVWASMTDDQLALWAEHLRSQVSTDGFPVLTATDPLRLAGAGEGGPFVSLDFGSPTGERQLSLQLRACETSQTNDDDFVALCRPEWSMWVSVSGDDQFEQSVAQTILIRNVRVADT